MSTSLPLSGRVLKVLIDEFGLASWDGDHVFADSTSRRYFAGQGIKDDNRRLVFEAATEALLASGMLPSVRLPGLRLPASLEPKVALTAALIAHADRWDELVGYLQTSSAPVAFPTQMLRAYLRLVTIDIAVRVGAVLWLCDGPEAKPPPVTWAKPKGGAMTLRFTIDRCGDRRPTRDDLFARLKVNPKTVDDWLDGKHRPSREHVERLAEVLAEHGAGDPAALLREIHLGFSLGALVDRLAEHVGRPAVEAMADRVVAYASTFPSFLAGSSKHRDQVDHSMALTLVAGTFPKAPPWLPSILNHVRRQEPDPVWRTELSAVCGSWSDRLQAVAAKLGPVDKEVLRQELGRVPSDEEVEGLADSVQASRAELLRDPAWRHVVGELMTEDPVFAAREYRSAGRAAADRGDLTQAVAFAREAVRLDPNEPEYHFRLGAYLGQLGVFDEALAETEVAAALDPKWDRPLVEIAIILFNAGRPEEALRRLEAAEKTLPKVTPWLLLNLGFVREALGKTKGAIEAFEGVLKIEPGHGEALDRVAHLYFLVGRGSEGRRCCKAARQRGFTESYSRWKAKVYRQRSGTTG